MMPVHLRGHHFLCILTYRGEGYTPDFVRNMSDIVAQIRSGAPVTLTDGPDMICAGLTAGCRIAVDHDCHKAEIATLDRMAEAAVAGILGRDLRAARELRADEIDLLRGEFRRGSIRAACVDCSWKPLCDGIVADDFAGTRL